MLTTKQITELQSRSIAQMLSDFGSGKDEVFFAEIANISLMPNLPKMEDAMRAFIKHQKTHQPHLLTKFQRLFHELEEATKGNEGEASAEKYAEFCTSVFVAVGQQVNFNVSLFEFLQLFKLTIKK